MDLEQAVQSYLEATSLLSGTTHVWYRQKLRVWMTWCQDNHLTLQDLRGRHLTTFQSYLLTQEVSHFSPAHPYNHSTLSPYTVRGYAQVVKGWSAWCYREEILPLDPFVHTDKVKQPSKVIETFSPEDIHQLLQAVAGQSLQAMRDRAVVLTLLDTGLRVSELVGMETSHLHLYDTPPWVYVPWKTSKGQKSREVGIGKAANMALRKYLQHRLPDKATDKVWLNRFGQPLTKSGVDQLITEIGKRTTISGVRISPHTFRHTMAVQFLKATGDIYRLSKILGHSTVSVTERYVQTFQSRDARERWMSVGDSFLS